MEESEVPSLTQRQRTFLWVLEFKVSLDKHEQEVPVGTESAITMHRVIGDGIRATIEDLQNQLKDQSDAELTHGQP